jgi:1-acyl-sn-glycerol-3-phosphate acyltransferase
MAALPVPLVPGPRAVLAAPLPELAPAHRRFALRLLLLACGGLVTVERPERLAALPEPAIFACNHNNSYEVLPVQAALLYLRRGRPVHFLADWMYLHLPAVGWLLRQAEPIPVWGKRARWRLGERFRRASHAPALDACLERLAAGASLGIFPEGTRNADPGRLLPARRGLGEIVLRSAAPVVPLGLCFPAARRLGRAPRCGRLVLTPGEPLDFTAERDAASALAPGPDRRAAARRIVHRVMNELARLTGKEPPEEPS